MPFHDLCDIGFSADPVPYSLRIDHHAGAEVTMVEAAGLISTDNVLEIKSLSFTFEVRVKFLRPKFCTTTAWIILWALVGADKDMSLKCRHWGIR